ncbi:MAG: Nif3-like dinuclear metal center hexameric protein [Bryobacterales bacterium]|nr:Nif3-like dinuclear metal center hexameric protein [Acidobacteriota bacterium]MCB9383575.1 Nif3-like dinuclear metal center hexameric protein [Bryobacterales bacterium]
MSRIDISRRRFVQLAGTAAAAPLASHGAEPLSANAIVVRLRAELGGDWITDGNDGFKAGAPDTPIRGIATTAMATVDVLRRAAGAGANLIVTLEPTFFGRNDGPAPPAPPGARAFPALRENDPVYRAKKKLIEHRGLVVFRLHDNWLAQKRAEMTAGLAESLGWGERRLDDALYEIPATSAEEAVAHVRAKLGLRGGLRAVGDRKATVRRVLLYPGFLDAQTMWKRYRDADLTLAGEVREWENTCYAADAFTAGEKRALVTIGRVASQDPGMRRCAEWLATVLPETPVRSIPAGDLYWRSVG